ncbi:uncharacterized protein LOC132696737 [Cylas formicarius]|uniref:uncharacterized protein LOC132696737 n=1 Tax=Cylas formicarius TaxID=197179 RepID=UPI0029584389|nr:uncharacterized protein LOC132696737 [Cylas formicarius]
MTAPVEENNLTNENSQEAIKETKKPSKRGIIYLSTIPPYMNVTKIREIFSEFGKLGRVYLQLADKGHGDKKKKKRKPAKKFTEGWVEFEKKCVAKRVATLLNNSQVSTRKSSKYYDCTWNIKYLSNFKWAHLHERLTYERSARNKKLKDEIQLTKKKANFFSSNLDSKKNKDVVNKEYEDITKIATETAMEVEDIEKESRAEFLRSLLP